MNGHTNLGLYRADQRNQAQRHAPDPDGVFDDLREAIDGTPNYVAVMGLGALAALIALKALGFRFAFGVNVGR